MRSPSSVVERLPLVASSVAHGRVTTPQKPIGPRSLTRFSVPLLPKPRFGAVSLSTGQFVQFKLLPIMRTKARMDCGWSSRNARERSVCAQVYLRALRRCRQRRANAACDRVRPCLRPRHVQAPRRSWEYPLVDPRGPIRPRREDNAATDDLSRFSKAARTGELACKGLREGGSEARRKRGSQSSAIGRYGHL